MPDLRERRTIIMADDVPQNIELLPSILENDYDVKPISPPIVMARVRTHLALYGESRKLDAQEWAVWPMCLML